MTYRDTLRSGAVRIAASVEGLVESSTTPELIGMPGNSRSRRHESGHDFSRAGNAFLFCHPQRPSGREGSTVSSIFSSLESGSHGRRELIQHTKYEAE